LFLIPVRPTFYRPPKQTLLVINCACDHDRKLYGHAMGKAKMRDGVSHFADTRRSESLESMVQVRCK